MVHNFMRQPNISAFEFSNSILEIYVVGHLQFSYDSTTDERLVSAFFFFLLRIKTLIFQNVEIKKSNNKRTS